MKKTTFKYSLSIVLLCVLLIPFNPVVAKDYKEKKKAPRRERKLKAFKASVGNKTRLTGYNFHQKTYLVKLPVNEVWKAYSALKPDQSWKGPLANYKQSYSSLKDAFYKPNIENHPPLEIGTVYFIKLSVLKILKIGVTFQVTKIDQKNKYIEMTYGLDNASHGRQRIYFIEDNKETIVLHTSNFKSDNKFRDKHLYPKFHEKFIDEFHRNIKENITSAQ